MKTAIIIFVGVVLICIVIRLCIEEKRRINRYMDMEYLFGGRASDEPEKPPSEAVAQQTVAKATPKPTFDDLLDAIEWVESRGDPNAVGDNGYAVGSFQIHKIYVDDVNRIICKRRMQVPTYAYKDRLDREKSLQMVLIYLENYRIYGVLDRYQALARIHVAGPEGWRNDPEWFVRNRGYSLEHAKDKIANAKLYWEKVKARLEK